ncbi:hypothetical protein CIHG_03060 [Coccidioides immitis H538.4]|uniref:Uncharacterized protein n=3 Tax=Coccidioides immitis TaxID=5501 RepID=A0A0J8R8H7_COCIT|nr:hypothetical protein CIRG_00753 [Coccidioides immitis RMSCC 2394]KMU80750.1 hypothetical protein CISG_08694 [Coccidioides immitis RMSCC 3703]KMU85276.1 hypothetical protein CIHG_03060 [Coccidioides immitis H538.4]
MSRAMAGLESGWKDSRCLKLCLAGCAAEEILLAKSGQHHQRGDDISPVDVTVCQVIDGLFRNPSASALREYTDNARLTVKVVLVSDFKVSGLDVPLNSGVKSTMIPKPW